MSGPKYLVDNFAKNLFINEWFGYLKEKRNRNKKMLFSLQHSFLLFIFYWDILF